MEQEQARIAIEKILQDSGYFLVNLEFTKGGDIQVYADNRDGITINECAALSRRIREELGEELDDFNLVVSSPGLDMPLKIPAQFEKNLGRMIQVILPSGERIRGRLARVWETGFEVEAEKRVLVPGKKKKTRVVEPIHLAFNEVKQTKLVISFK